MNRQFTKVVLFLAALCAFIVGALYVAHVNASDESLAPVESAMPYMRDLQGVVTGVNHATDGMQITLENDEKTYSITLSMMQARVYGRYNQIEAGSGLRVSGPVIPGTEPALIVAEEVTVLGVDVDYVNNLHGTIIALEQGKDGFNATVETNDGNQVTSTISYVSTQIIFLENAEEILVGAPVTLTGALLDLGQPHVAADIAVLQPVMDHTNAVAAQPLVVQ